MYTTSDTCAAVDLQQPALQQWFKRKLVSLERSAEDPRSGSFSVQDVAVLSLTKALSGVGLSVPEGFAVASRVIEARYIRQDPPPLEKLRSPRAVIVVYRDREGRIHVQFYGDKPITPRRKTNPVPSFDLPAPYVVVDIARTPVVKPASMRARRRQSAN